jgi:hypothetical protein
MQSGTKFIEPRLKYARREARLPKQGFAMLKSILFVLAVSVFAIPTSAQNTQPVAADQKQCADQFKAADLNNDGVLSRSEIGNAKQSLPASLANKDRVTRAEFMAVCANNAS